MTAIGIHAGPERAAVDVVQVVRGVHEDAAQGGAHQAPVDVRRVAGGELRRPLGRDGAAGVADHPGLGPRPEARGRGAERRPQGVERVAAVLGPGGEVGVLALDVGDRDGVGLIAQALLRRLDSRESLSALADPAAPTLLSSLVARSRKKLAQYVRKELEKAQLAVVDETVVVDLLNADGLFAELDTRTLDQLQGATKLSAEALLTALGPLSDAGFVQRGRALRCPLCRSPDFWRLAELDEELQCRACRQTFPLPAVENGREASTSYRLDGLTARAMSQDLIPVLLTLRHLLLRPEATADAQWWPGLNLFEGDSEQPDDEVDLVVADQGRLRVCEVKATAPGVTAEGVTDLIATAERIGAEPVIAALDGEWRDEVVELLDHEQFLLLGAGELLEST